MTRPCKNEPKPLSEEKYLAQFDGTESNKRLEAFREAVAIRRFEIEQYWKRAAYFWTFIAGAFVGYFALQKTKGDQSPGLVFTVCCLGIVLTVAWYFAIRGSKFWHYNWERHVDRLEDEITGPLYKTILNPCEPKFRSILGPFPFSVTKINEILSLYVAAIWLFLALHTLAGTRHWWPEEQFNGANEVIVAGISLIFIGVLFFQGRTDPTNKGSKMIRRDDWVASEKLQGETKSPSGPASS